MTTLVVTARRLFGSDRVRALTVLSWLLTALVPLLGHTRLGDLSNHFGDHLHHAWATDIFFHRGLAIYRVPFGQLWAGSTYPQPEPAWGDMARPYPPGVFLLFAPLVLLARTVAMSKARFGAIAIVYLLALTHVGLLALFRLLARSGPGARIIAGGLLWAIFVHLALEGFYDPVWIGCGVLCAKALHEGRPTAALRWFGTAALLHFRAVTLLPLGVWAVLEAIRDRTWPRWPWTTLVPVALTLTVVVGSFVLVYPGTAARRALHPPWPMLIATPEFAMLAVLTIVGATTAVVCRDLALGGVMLIVGGLAVVDLGVYRGYWHHAAIATVAVVTALARDDRTSALRRQVAVLWLIAVVPVVWLANPAALIIDIVKGFRPHI